MQKDYGYNVVYVVDAMTDRDFVSHRHGMERVFPWDGRAGEHRRGTEDVEGNSGAAIRG